MKLVFIAALLAFASIAQAQATQYCVCVSGCDVTAPSYPPGPNQPTQCTGYIGATKYGPFPVVDAATIATSNATRCTPPDTAYVPGPAGSVACLVSIPAQSPNSTVSVKLSATNVAGESGQSTALTFQSVSALPTIPTVPGNPRLNK